MPQSPEYSIWVGMKKRCANPRARGYANYGGRGLRVCARWSAAFADFLADLGPRPSLSHELERPDNSRGYSCGQCADCHERGETRNCLWATRAEGARNRRDTRRVAHDGVTLTVPEWAQRTGLPVDTLRRRLREGWPVAEALTVPLVKRAA